MTYYGHFYSLSAHLLEKPSAAITHSLSGVAPCSPHLALLVRNCSDRIDPKEDQRREGANFALCCSTPLIIRSSTKGHLLKAPRSSTLLFCLSPSPRLKIQNEQIKSDVDWKQLGQDQRRPSDLKEGAAPAPPRHDRWSLACTVEGMHEP